MYFDSAEKGLIVKSLDGLKDNLERSRSLFDVGSTERANIENKFEMIYDIKNKLNDNIEFTSGEKKLILEGLDIFKDRCEKNRSIFDVGTVERASLESDFTRAFKIRTSLENSNAKSSLDSLINLAKQREQAQPHSNNLQKNNDLTL